VPCDAESTYSRESVCLPWDSTHRSRCEEPQCAHWLDPAIGPRGSDLLCQFHPEPFTYAPHDGTYAMGSDLVRASATVGCDSFAGSCSPLRGLAREDRLLPCIRAKSLSRRLGCHTRPIVRTQWEGWSLEPDLPGYCPQDFGLTRCLERTQWDPALALTATRDRVIRPTP
jgi:hypothetical protein